MRKLKLYIAVSLNGKIAKKDGDVSWLHEIPNSENIDFGYDDFYKSVGVTIQGYSTYKQVLDWGIDFPYKGTKNYVFTTKSEIVDTKDVIFIKENHIDFVKNLKMENGKDIWLIGGGQINTLLLNANLIDEMQIFVMPIVLSEGIELFEKIPNEIKLNLVTTKRYTNGVVELNYTLN